MKKISVQLSLDKLREVAIRFTFTLFYILGLCYLLFWQIKLESTPIDPRLWVFFSLGILLSLAVSLYSEAFKSWIVRALMNSISMIVLLVYCYFLPQKLLQYQSSQVFILGIVCFLALFFVSFLKKDTDISFWEFGKEMLIQAFISSMFANILMLGLSLAILSLKELFKLDTPKHIYEYLAVFCYVLFATIYFLANVPTKTDKQKQEYVFNKFIKILGMYILLPILALYTLILYVYLFQILLKWELPNGWVSTLVSVLGVGGFLCMLILYPLRVEKENKLINFLFRFFPLILFPLLVLMSIGIFRRLGDYGLTINRLYVLILNVWLYGICVYLYISKANHLKWILISFTTILFISSVGSWSVYSITKRVMMKEIEQLLTKTKVLKNGKIVDNRTKTIAIDPKLANSLADYISYVYTNFGAETLQPFFTKAIMKNGVFGMKEYLGILNLPSEDEYFNVWAERDGNGISTINSYRYFLYLPNFDGNSGPILTNSRYSISIKNLQIQVVAKQKSENPFVIPLKPTLKSIFKQQKLRNSFPVDQLTLKTESYLLILNSVQGQYHAVNDSISVSNCDALLFIK